MVTRLFTVTNATAASAHCGLLNLLKSFLFVCCFGHCSTADAMCFTSILEELEMLHRPDCQSGRYIFPDPPGF